MENSLQRIDFDSVIKYGYVYECSGSVFNLDSLIEIIYEIGNNKKEHSGNYELHVRRDIFFSIKDELMQLLSYRTDDDVSGFNDTDGSYKFQYAGFHVSVFINLGVYGVFFDKKDYVNSVYFKQGAIYDGVKYVDPFLNDEAGHFAGNEGLFKQVKGIDKNLNPVIVNVPAIKPKNFNEILEMYFSRGILIADENNSSWISVDDRLPENDDDVLAFWVGLDRLECVRTLSYDASSEEWSDWNGEEYKRIQYWKPIGNMPENYKFDNE